MANGNKDGDEAVSIPITRTELVWPGKYNSDGTLKEPPRVSLPFQVIERVNETRATREARKEPQELSLFDVWEGDEGDSFEDGWRNKLIWGDNLLVMSSLLENFAGEIDLIYIDPPFATGADFKLDAEIGDGTSSVEKEASLIEEKAYRDTWAAGVDSYLSMLSSRLGLMRDLLSQNGTIYLHMGTEMSGPAQLLLEEVFGREQNLNQIIWQYKYGGRAGNAFGRKHDVLLRFGKQPDPYFDMDAVRVPVEDASLLANYRYVDENGRRYRKGTWKSGKEYRYYADEGRTPDDVWSDINSIHAASKERMGYPTQKPEELLQRVVKASSRPGALVADFFCGSGTTLAVAEKLGRRWIGCDLGRWAIHTSRKRLLEVPEGRPFEVLNLGKYERQYWQGITFGEDRSPTQHALFEYLAFILRLYGAEPVSGLAHLHGKKGSAMIHISSVDTPVTIDEIDEAITECAALEQGELHVLGWEWEMGLYELMVEEAKKRGIKLLLLQIPREVMEQQAVDKGDVQFFELAHLELEVNLDGRVSAVSLSDFVIPNTELIPEEVRDKVDKWSDYIDYWAVDWDFRGDTFMQGWVTYRTRNNRKLELTSDPHTYERSGIYTIVVKVIDIFGNDTSQAYEVRVD